MFNIPCVPVKRGILEKRAGGRIKSQMTKSLAPVPGRSESPFHPHSRREFRKPGGGAGSFFSSPLPADWRRPFAGADRAAGLFPVPARLQSCLNIGRTGKPINLFSTFPSAAPTQQMHTEKMISAGTNFIRFSSAANSASDTAAVVSCAKPRRAARTRPASARDNQSGPRNACRPRRA